MKCICNGTNPFCLACRGTGLVQTAESSKKKAGKTKGHQKRKEPKAHPRQAAMSHYRICNICSAKAKSWDELVHHVLKIHGFDISPKPSKGMRKCCFCNLDILETRYAAHVHKVHHPIKASPSLPTKSKKTIVPQTRVIFVSGGGIETNRRKH